jgi:hypothetical protein
MMTEVTTLDLPAEKPEVTTQPVFTMLDTVTDHTCDGCGPAVVALIEVCLPPTDKLPEGGSLSLCGHHGRAFGFEPHQHPSLANENKLQGSDH